MNHESRIKQLETEIINLKQILRGAGLLEKFVPLSIASNALGDSPWVIKDRSDILPRFIEGGCHLADNYLCINLDRCLSENV